MTDKEAIEVLKVAKAEVEWEYPLDYQIAFDKAIKALEQEPCEDCVGRQKLKEQMIKYGFHAPDMTVTEFVEDLPPATPQPKTGHWIDTGSGQECSECHEIQHGYDNFRFYCAKCGSKNVIESEV